MNSYARECVLFLVLLRHPRNVRCDNLDSVSPWLASHTNLRHDTRTHTTTQHVMGKRNYYIFSNKFWICCVFSWWAWRPCHREKSSDREREGERYFLPIGENVHINCRISAHGRGKLKFCVWLLLRTLHGVHEPRSNVLSSIWTKVNQSLTHSISTDFPLK